MKAITFIIKTQQPILATSFQGDPNSDVSYSYIPGSMIRGVLIGRYLKHNGLENTDILMNEAVKRLFFDGSTRYLNAYLSSQEGKRTFPTLFCWRKEKGTQLDEKSKELKIYDFSVEKSYIESPKSLGESFWLEEAGYVRLYSVDRRINIHNMRDRRKGRSVPNKINAVTGEVIEEGEGAIFRYDAIDAGQSFVGVILCNDDDEQTIRSLLTPSDIRIGGSRSAGYGYAQISNIKSFDSWHEIDESPEKRFKFKDIKITLLSNMILRDNYGQYIAMPPTELLSDALGIPLEELKLKTAYSDRTYIGGFNRKWGLPLPQVPAVTAGSVFVYENVSITATQIQQLETEGIGERTVEGFGRIAVNWQMEKSSFTAKLPEPREFPRRKQPKLDNEESQNLARQMAERILRQKLEQLLLDRVTYTQVQGKITNSQLSRLEIVARQGLTLNSRLPVFRLLRYLPSNARNQFRQANVSGKPLDQQIYEWLRKPTSWINSQDNLEITIAGVSKSLNHRLAIEYTLQLIMAIAKNATKEASND